MLGRARIPLIMRSRFILVFLFCLLAAGALWLRWPALGFAVWNVDEAIHSAVAHTLREGGVLYRDAIDQRTPLTYYLVAAVYAVAGQNNLFALHVVVALLVAGTAFCLLLAARAWGRPGAGGWAAALYVALSTCLLYAGDANAFNTEWSLAFFTALAAAIFAGGGAHTGARRLLATGGALGLAFLSKQPALLDAAVPALALCHHAWRQPEDRRGLAARLALLGAGFAAPVLAVAAYFAAQGALGDAIYYAWSYNLSVYGPEITTPDRLFSVAHLVEMFLHGAPLVLAVLLVAAPLAANTVLQRVPDERERRDRPLLFYTLAWTVTALGAALSGGRGFDHYFVQTLPPLCLLAGWLLARLSLVAWAPYGRRTARLGAALALLAVAAGVVHSAWLARGRTLAPDVSRRTADYVRAQTEPGDRIFVWGFHPEFHLFTGRAPASRFVYGSFLTGLVPWTNVAPDRDTAYAIVPGALETLLADLERTRPVFLIDCSAGPNRFWQKYPLEHFPPLQAFVDRHYVRATPEHLRGQGFDLYLIRDESRLAPVVLRDGGPAELDVPAWQGPEVFAVRPSPVTVQGNSPNGRLRRLELLVNGEVVTGATFAAGDWARFGTDLPFDRLGAGRHVVQARAWGADGSVRDGEPRTVTVTNELLTGDALAPFALARVTDPLAPDYVEAPYGASAELTDGRTFFYVHAPSRLVFPLPPQAARLTGGFGLRPAAYADDHPTPTDGAEFRVERVTGDGTRRVLYRRLLDPRQRPEDRGVQSFAVHLGGAGGDGERLELVITTGPMGSAAADWTFWSDLRLETSR